MYRAWHHNFDTDIKPVEPKPEKILGLDYSSKALYVDSEMNTPEYPWIFISGYLVSKRERISGITYSPIDRVAPKENCIVSVRTWLMFSLKCLESEKVVVENSLNSSP